MGSVQLSYIAPSMHLSGAYAPPNFSKHPVSCRYLLLQTQCFFDANDTTLVNGALEYPKKQNKYIPSLLRLPQQHFA